MEKKEFSFKVGDKTLKIEKNIMAEQANGALLISCGETIVLATAVMSKSASNLPYFPLSVEYQEKYYASGKIPGSFLKREARPTDGSILTSRLIDRCLRPLFDHDIKNSIQIIASVLSIDSENSADVLAMNGVSLALCISDIPFLGPIGAVRVGKINGAFVINPTKEERAESDLDLVVAGTKDRINMVEAGANEVPEDEIVKAFEFAKKEIENIVNEQEKITKEIGKEKLDLGLQKPEENFIKEVQEQVSEKIEDILYTPEKQERTEEINDIKKSLIQHLEEKYPENPEFISMGDKVFEDEIDRITHINILEKGKRSDGRKPDELRKLTTEVGLLPRTHGSGFFLRGQTQALSILTLGSTGEAQIIDTMEEDSKKYFFHHYNFPPFSVGEAGPMRGPGRRDIGHGALAERALLAVMPTKEEFPYTIRLVSEILSSNGSSSMASVCGSILAMMDGGVPIKKMAAGIAMGLMSDKNGNYVVLTDIQGPEDHHGDMDFKVAGTVDGITALQMDVKIDGVTVKMLKDTLDQAKEARIKILDNMKATISEPRKSLSKYAPKIESIKIDSDKIGLVIGGGGKTINGIIEDTRVTIDIEDDGTIFIGSSDQKAIDQAREIIEGLTKEPKIGEIYKDAKVTKTTDFGAFVEILPKKEGLVHISNMAKDRVNNVTDVVKEGDLVTVKILNIDNIGRIQLSMKDIQEN
jgi:polyribonucleotide nucleotidyltransferase